MEAQVFPDSVSKGFVTTQFLVFDVEKTFEKSLCILAGQKYI